MIDFENWDNVQPITGGGETLEAGGYICKIKGVKIETSSTKKRMLALAFDIDEGEKAGFYQRKFDNDTRTDKKWPGIYRQMLEGDKAAGYFKGLITSLEASNNGFNWVACGKEESKLVGLKFGGVFGEEEYEYGGEVRTTVKIRYAISTDKVRNDDFKIPKKKEIPNNSNPYAGTPFDTGMTPANSNEEFIPF